MIGLLRNGPSIWKGLSSGFSPPNQDQLDFWWEGGYDGTDLVNKKGTNIPYVSGTGLDAIYNFSVLNDDRFDKGATVGNALSLPEYYNDPLNAYFYYDGTSETTRRYWKLKDFHYFYVQQQTDITPQLLNNWCFLKATATSDMSNEIESVQKLLIYSSEYIETTCYSTGTIYKDSVQVYGEWNVSVNLSSLGNHDFYIIANDNTVGTFKNKYYWMRFQTDGAISFLSKTDTLFRTKVDYFDHDTNYDVKIVRNSIENEYVTGAIGTFAVYIKGGSFGDSYVLLDTTDGVGSNPVTNDTYKICSYSLIYLTATSLVSNFKLNDAVQTFDTFTTISGLFVNVLSGEQTENNLTKLRSYSNLYLNLTDWFYYGHSYTQINPILIDETPMIVNESYRIYNDEVAYVDIGKLNEFEFIWTCDIGSSDSLGFTLTPAIGDVGNHTISLSINRYGSEIATASGTLKFLAGGNGSGTKTILCVGDSLLVSEDIVSDIRTGLTGITASMVGTQGSSPNEHEGHSGWTFSNFLGSSSPFWDGSKIDVTDYRTNTLGLANPIDFVIIQLGVNSITTNNISPSYVRSTLINDVKSLVDEFIADSTVKILIACESKCENSGDGWFADYGTARNQDYYMEKMQALWDEIKQTFDDVVYDSSVVVVMPALNLDRDDGYPKIDGVHTNGVHPNATGYGQLSKLYISAIENEL